MSTQSKRIAKNGLALMISGAVGGALNLFAVMLVSHYLDVADFGLFSFLLSFATVIQFVADFGLSNILMREMSRTPDEAPRLLGAAKGLNWMLFGILTLSMLILVCLLPLKLTVKELTITMGFAYLCLFQSVSYVAVLRAKERMEFNALGFTLHKVVLVSAVWLSLHAGFGLWGVVCSHFCANLFQWLFFWASAAWIGVRGRIRVDIPLWKSLISEALPMGGGLVIRQISWQSDIFMVKGLTDAAALGLFSGPFRLLIGLSIVPTFLALPLFPLFVRLAATSLPDFTVAYNRAFRAFSLICFPSSAFLLAWPELWLRLLFGPSYIVAAPILQILSVTMLPIFMMGLFPLLYSAFNIQRQFMAILGGWLIIRLAAGLMLIPQWGGVGAASIILVCEFGILFTLTWGFERRGIHLAWMDVCAKPLAACAPLLVILGQFREAPIWELFPAAMGGALAYAAMVWGLGCLTAPEKQLILELLPRLLARGKKSLPTGVL